jgi:signal transduction histidine kinase
MLPDFRVRQRDYLLEISRALTQELDLDILLERILRISIEMLAGKTGLIALRSESEGWRVVSSQGLPQAFLNYLTPLLHEIPQEPENPGSKEIPVINQLLKRLTFAASWGLMTGVGLPLVARKQVVGVIFIFRGYQGLFSNNDHALLSSFADQAAIAVQNAQLYTQVNQERQRMGALLDSAADGILILSPDHRIERCNRAFATVLGSQVSNLQGLHHDKAIRWLRPPEGLTLGQAEAGGWPLTASAQLYVEGDLKRLDNQVPVPVGVTYAPLLSEKGALTNIIVTVRDITRFRQAEELKSTFISIISHELKTPVALIKGYVGTLRREDARWERHIVEDSLEVIEEEADRLTELIENLLDASRLQAGGMALKLCDLLLPEVVTRLARRFETQTTRHTLTADFPADFPVILADETRIEQVISNLISNAIKYAPEGEILIRGSARTETIIVCVSDQGPGIDPNDMPHIFDRFYRAPDMARHTKGAGLGLFLTRAIVEAHGGRIWVDAGPGNGAHICFSLPRHLETL